MMNGIPVAADAADTAEALAAIPTPQLSHILLKVLLLH